MLDELLPADFALASGNPLDPAPPLLAGEEQIVMQAVEKRRREFAKGRECARTALAKLGIVGVPLLQGPRREPLWPEAVVGSITHTNCFCAAVAGSKQSYDGVGIDAEPDEPLGPELVDRICQPQELLPLASVCDPGTAARLVFCAKEAFYKCQYPLTGAFLDFSDVVVEARADGTFSVRVRAPGLPSHVQRALGRWRRGDGLLLTAAWLPGTRVT